MVIVQAREGHASCSLSADLRPSGDLAVTGHDLSVERDSEYVYTIRAAAVPRLCERLDVEAGELVDGLRRLLAPHGVAAGTMWRTWLKAHDVPYELTIR
jgi:hypothetical protein